MTWELLVPWLSFRKSCTRTSTVDRDDVPRVRPNQSMVAFNLNGDKSS